MKALPEVLKLENTGLEALTALYVAARVAPAGRNPKKMAEAIDANWRAFYSLADQVPTFCSKRTHSVVREHILLFTHLQIRY